MTKTANLASSKAIRHAHHLRRLLEAGMVMGGAALAGLWMFGLGQRQLGSVGIILQGPQALVGYPRLGQIAFSATLLVMLYGLWRLRRMLCCFERGDFFGLTPVLHLRAFALTLLLVPLLNVLVPPLLQAVLHVTGIASWVSLSLELDGADAWSLLVGGLFYLIAWTLVEARRAAEDSAEII